MMTDMTCDKFSSYDCCDAIVRETNLPLELIDIVRGYLGNNTIVTLAHAINFYYNDIEFYIRDGYLIGKHDRWEYKITPATVVGGYGNKLIYCDGEEICIVDLDAKWDVYNNTSYYWNMSVVCRIKAPCTRLTCYGLCFKAECRGDCGVFTYDGKPLSREAVINSHLNLYARQCAWVISESAGCATSIRIHTPQYTCVIRDMYDIEIYNSRGLVVRMRVNYPVGCGRFTVKDFGDSFILANGDKVWLVDVFGRRDERFYEMTNEKFGTFRSLNEQMYGSGYYLI